MAARPGGYASKAEQARRLEIVRELWPTDRSTRMIGERIGMCESAVSLIARAAGLPPRHRARFLLTHANESVVSR